MWPRYHLDLIRDAADQVIYQESANYGNFFTVLLLGVGMWAFAVAWVYIGADAPSNRKLLSSLFGGGFCLYFLSLPYLVRSRITLDRGQGTLSIRRNFLGIPWTHRVRIEDIEEIYEGGDPRGASKRQLGIEMTNARTRKLTMWAKQNSLAAEVAHLNHALDQMRRHGGGQTGRVHTPMTEDEWSRHTRENARVDFRRGLKRTFYLLGGFLAAAAAMVPFLAGYPLHRYWHSLGTLLLLLSMGFGAALIFVAMSSFISWQYMRDLKKIDKAFGSEER